MSAFKIGGSPFRPANGVSGGKKPEAAKADGSVAAPSPKGGAYDTLRLRDNPLAVMPRMSSVGRESAQQVQSKTVESLLKDSSAELDGYFASAYGFKE